MQKKSVIERKSCILTTIVCFPGCKRSQLSRYSCRFIFVFAFQDAEVSHLAIYWCKLTLVFVSPGCRRSLLSRGRSAWPGRGKRLTDVRKESRPLHLPYHPDPPPRIRVPREELQEPLLPLSSLQHNHNNRLVPREELLPHNNNHNKMVEMYSIAWPPHVSNSKSRRRV